MAGVLDDVAVLQRQSARDFLPSTGFRFWIHRLPTVSFRAQRVVIPGVELPPAMEPNLFAPIPQAGDRATFGELQVTYLVDEDMRNYTEVLGWIYGLGRPDDFEQYSAIVREPGTGVKSDVTLLALDHAKQPRTEIVFRQCVPVSIGDLVFEATTGELQFVSVTATFRFVQMEVNPSTT